MLEYTEYTKMLIGLIAIVNPIGAIPIFITLTSHKGTGLLHYMIVGLVISITSLLLYIVFKFVPYMSKYISQTGINVFTRIMGLILAAIAIEFIASGIKGLFPALS